MTYSKLITSEEYNLEMGRAYDNGLKAGANLALATLEYFQVQKEAITKVKEVMQRAIDAHEQKRAEIEQVST